MSRRNLVALLLTVSLAAAGGFALRWLQLGAPGDRCEVDGDCRGSAICLQSHRSRLCTELCTTDDDCASGLVCRVADVEGEDTERHVEATVCAPRQPTLDDVRHLPP